MSGIYRERVSSQDKDNEDKEYFINSDTDSDNDDDGLFKQGILHINLLVLYNVG